MLMAQEWLSPLEEQVMMPVSGMLMLPDLLWKNKREDSFSLT